MRAGSRGRRIVVWRHGQSTCNAAGIWQGHLDAPLSEVGVNQARMAAPAVAAYEPSVIVASDLQRARNTAATLADLLGLPVRIDPRFREINVGNWAGMTTAQVTERWPAEQDALARGDDIRRGETGETLAEVATRAHAGLLDVIAELDDGQTAVVAAHGVSGRAAVAALAGIEQHVAWQALAGLGNAHWAVLGEGRSGWRVEEWNGRASATA